MLTRRILTIIPFLVIVVLFQAAFWVPTYERQDVAGEERLHTFIEGSIGDAKFLNPIIATDGASMDIAALIFEGLIDIDEDLDFVGGLAEGWETTSTAYLNVLPDRRLPGGTPASARNVAARLEQALAAGELGWLDEDIESIRVLPPETTTQTLTLFEKSEAEDDSSPGTPRPVEVEIARPARVEIALARVVPDLASQLEPAVGAELLAPPPSGTALSTEDPADLAKLGEQTLGLFEVLEQNPVMLFHLRRGVKFHDGHGFDSGDVVFSYRAFLDPKNASPRASTWEPVKSVEALDAHTVRVVYKRLYSPATLAWSGPMILPEHLMNDAALEREMDRRGIEGEARKAFGLRQSDTTRNPIGTGQFRFVEWNSDEYLHLRAFEDHWKKVPEYKEYYYRVIPELVTQEVEFRSGGIDAYAPPPYQIPRYANDSDFHLLSAIQGYYAYIGYNLRKPPFDDIRVRKALGMAIDVDAIIEYVLYGQGDRVSGPYYISTPFYNPETPMLPYDPEGAAALLAEAGWKKGPDGILAKNGERLAFSLATNNGNPQRKAMVTIAQNAWKKLGVDVSTRLLEWTVFIEQFARLEHDAVLLAWGGGALNPDLYQLWHSSQTDEQQLNRGGYANPEADALIERIRRTYDPQEQRRLGWQLHDLIARDHPMTFLYSARANVVLDRKIVHVERDEAGVERYKRIEPTAAGEIKFWFDHWRKLAQPIAFEAKR